VPDPDHSGMWRVHWPDGRRSDIVNLSRAKDALASFVETEQRRHRRGRQTPPEALPIRCSGKAVPRDARGTRALSMQPADAMDAVPSTLQTAGSGGGGGARSPK
jgi:hypothetical protein